MSKPRMRWQVDKCIRKRKVPFVHGLHQRLLCDGVRWVLESAPRIVYDAAVAGGSVAPASGSHQPAQSVRNISSRKQILPERSVALPLHAAARCAGMRVALRLLGHRSTANKQ